ncbi:MAG: energy-coupling factor ABC transporter ATP-binding protein [Treponema sp.]|jgi:biotin transport system ATP-binding protein|nr:energy-coupling factor ABC transporter ATP-binding protein [Treponema sp.]
MNGIPLFSIRGLSKNFPAANDRGGSGVNRALRGLNLDIREGECLLIAGSNGSGKTILMKIIAGLMDPSEGDVLFRGQPLAKAGDALRTSLGLVFQDADAQILGETVAEDAAFGPRNLGLSREQAAERAEAALRALGIEDKRDFPPRRLSGGEKRRLAVAGVIAMGCDTLILDEPFANLDWPGVVHVLEIVRDLKAAGKTLIILTHELEKVLAFADRLVILHRGVLREDGRPEEVLDRLRPEYGVRNPLHGYHRVGDCTWLA